MKRRLLGRYQHAGWPQQAARASTARAMQRLGFHANDAGILIRAGMLVSLGHPAPNGPKFFAADYLEELAHDELWLGRASDIVTAEHREANAKPDRKVGRSKNTNRSRRRGRGAADLDESETEGDR